MPSEDSSSPKKAEKAKKHTRSRFGCVRCKRLKVKCDEMKPSCSLCVKNGDVCDYTLKLTWGGRPYKKQKTNNLAIGTIMSFEQKYNKNTVPDGNNTDTASETSPRESRSSTPLPSGTPNPEHDVPVAAQEEIQPSKIHKELDHPSLQITFPPSPPHDIITPIETNGQPHCHSLEYNAHMPSNVELQLMSALRGFESSDSTGEKFLDNMLLPSFESAHSTLSPGMTDDDSSPGLTLMEKLHYFNSHSTDLTNDTTGMILHQAHTFTGLEYIPDLLSPLPDFLQHNSFYREYYHSYIQVFSKALCPAPPTTYKENPFTCILPKLSFSAGTDGILAILTSFGLCQATSYKQQPFPKRAVDELVRIALNDLYSRLTDPKEATSDYTLALILILSTFETLCYKSDGWRAHFFGAKKIMLTRGLLKGSARPNIRLRDRVSSHVKIDPMDLVRGNEGDMAFFFKRWFAYTDVIGSLSSSSSIYAEPSRTGQFHWLSSVPSTKDREQLKDIDPFMGFDFQLLQHFSMIIKLLKEKETGLSSYPDTLSVTLIHEAMEVKEALMTYLEESEKERDEIEKRIKADPLCPLNSQLADYHVLRSTNLVFGLSGVLQIFRRLLLFPRESILVQKVVTSISQCFADYIDREQPAAHATIFSLFTTGCEVLDDDSREFFMERVRILAANGWNSARLGQEIMMESWCTGKYWADIVADRKVDLVFL